MRPGRTPPFAGSAPGRAYARDGRQAYARAGRRVHACWPRPGRRSLFRTLVWLPAAAALLASWTGHAAAQEPPTGVVTGTVTGEDAATLTGVEVTVVGLALGTVTGADGRFRIARIPPGAAVLEVRMMGYRPAAFPIDVAAGVTLELALALEVSPVPLDPLEVRAQQRLSPEMRGFYERRERGAGHFFTREEIGRMQSRLVTDVLRRAPGVRVEPTSGTRGIGHVVRMRRATGIAGSRACPVLYYVNGAPFPLDANLGIDQFVRPDEIAGIEVYSGPAQLPPRFHSSNQGARCGVIIIWTYQGERRRAGDVR